MHLSSAILGETIVKKLNERQSGAVLAIGADTFTRPQLSRIGCFNFTAAARLSHFFTAELKVKNTTDLFRNVPPAHLAIPGLGAICLATIGACFEIKGLGNLADYIARHTQKGTAVVTFATFKHNILDIQAATNERREAKERKTRRLDKATKLKGDRHIERTTNGKTSNGTTVS